MLIKNTLKKITKSWGRYFSLLFIVLLGVAFFTGIKESVPNIKNVQTDYYNETNLMDLKIVSTLGFNTEDIDAIAELDGVLDVVGSFSKNVLVGDEVVKIYAIDENINKAYLVEGKLPTQENECLADSRYYKLDDTIKINDNYLDDLKNGEYKVVGTIYSPLYTTTDYGSADIGDGKLDSFIFVSRTNFEYDYYTEVYLTIDKTKEDFPYSKSYDDKIEEVSKKIESIKDDRLKTRLKELMLSSYSASINSSSNREAWISENDWYILTRGDVITSYTILDSQYDQVTTIANVIPVFFVLIVVLMTSNTMSRMIAEERVEIGTLSSLGVSNVKIILTYLLYVLSSTILGSIIGYFVGTIFIPSFVYNCFPIIFPKITYRFNGGLLIGVLFISCLVMTLVTIYSCLKELKDKPAYLLRPVAPKSGKKIFLERLKFIWNKLSFSSKITIRNISRYKKRVIMTIVGIMGCTFLIMIGFALKDSINCVGDKQFNELFKYDNLMILNENIEALDKELFDTYAGLVDDVVLLNQTAYKVVDKETSLDVYMVIPEASEAGFSDYFILRDEDTKKRLELRDDGVIVTPKISERFGVKIGDTITIENLDQKEFTVKVVGITENYVANYIYMSNSYYEEIFGEKVKYNVVVSKNLESKNTIATELLKSEKILSINFREDLLETANAGVSGLNNIVVLLVIISSLLAFTVLYNLTSINISERTREIATLKVLGFYDGETNEYIYREIMITVIVGIILGLCLTPILHDYIMDLLETDTTIFLREIKVHSYIYSSVLTILFAIIMQIITYFKLKKVNMIEALKSVE